MSQPRLCCQVGWLRQNSFAQAAGRVTRHAGVWSCQSPLQSTPAIAFCVCIGILLNACRGTAPPPLQAWPRALFSTLLLFQRIRSRNFSPLPRLRLQAHRKLHGRGMRVPRKLTATKTSAWLWCHLFKYLNLFGSHLFKLFLSSPSCMADIFGASHNSCDFKIYSEVCYRFRQRTLWDFAQYHIHIWSPHKPCSAFRYSSSLVFVLSSWLQLFM